MAVDMLFEISSLNAEIRELRKLRDEWKEGYFRNGDIISNQREEIDSLKQQVSELKDGGSWYNEWKYEQRQRLMVEGQMKDLKEQYESAVFAAANYARWIVDALEPLRQPDVQPYDATSSSG
jgi:chromosome segregation ATPase